MGVLRGARGVLVVELLPHLCCLLVSAAALDIIEENPPELKCSEGLLVCHLTKEAEFTAALPEPNGILDVTLMKLKVSLCHNKPCLQVDLTLKEEENFIDISDGSGNFDEEVTVTVCLSVPPGVNVCKVVEVKPAKPEISQIKLLLTKQVEFGDIVVVAAYSKNDLVQSITIPSLEEVCSLKIHKNMMECTVPRLRAVPDLNRNVVRLQLQNGNFKEEKLPLQILWADIFKKVFIWPNSTREISISSEYLAPCLCFKVRWQKDCPFKENRAVLRRMLQNVSLMLVETGVRGGGRGLSWNVTSPCAVDAELWLCRKDLAKGRCQEVIGSRQKLQANWIAERGTHWQTGEFNGSREALLCVQLKINGTESILTQCPFQTPKVGWIVPLLLGFFLMCLAIFGAYIAQGVLKGYVWKWLKDSDVKGAVGGGHVVLLFPPDENEEDLPGLLCQLGSSLQDLGFTVSLDLWSQAELSILGPVPWLHSRLDRLQRQGGKVVLVLTQVTWTRAEEWEAWSSGRSIPCEKNKSEERKPSQGRFPAMPHSADVFGASLSCILADSLQGRAGERFMLIQFESLPPEPPGSCRQLPQLFRGLHVFSLPSQSLGFLTELAGAQRTVRTSSRLKKIGGLRIASRALAQKLSDFTAGINVLQLPLMSQSCIGVKDSAETVPVTSCPITCSLDTDITASDTDWE